MKKILKNELNIDTDRLPGPIIQPSKPMAGLKYVPCDKGRGKSRGCNLGDNTVEDDL